MVQPYDSLIVRTVCKVLIPFAQVFALYVLVHGHESPGGGFQGGAIFAASIILNRFTSGRETIPRYLPGTWALRAGAIGVLIYGGVGLVAMLFGGEFLDYGHLPFPGMEAADRRHLGILFVEVGVALAVTGILVSIFDDLAPDSAPLPSAGAETVDKCEETLRRAQGERKKASENNPPAAQAELVEASYGRKSTVPAGEGGA